MSSIGRPTVFDKGKAKRICQRVAGGTPMQYAAESVGVSEATLYRWMEYGKRDDAPPEFRQFREDIHSARSKALVYRIARIRKHGKSNPKCDQWWCERMFPDEFGGDKKSLKEMVQEIGRMRAELDAANAALQRNQKKSRKRKKRRHGVVRGDGEGV